jgi:hypothetical protein
MADGMSDTMLKKQERAKDAEKAWSGHLAEQKAIADRTARLRAARLAREAEVAAAPVPPPATAPAKKAKKTKTPAKSS